MEDSVAMFRSITDDYAISEQEIRKFLTWGKGSIDHALNYYYRKREKEEKKGGRQDKIVEKEERKTQSTQPVVAEDTQDVFSKMRKASLRQKKTDEFIHSVREEYKLPIKGRASLKAAKGDKQKEEELELMDAEFADADYLPEVFTMKDEGVDRILQEARFRTDRRSQQIEEYELEHSQSVEVDNDSQFVDEIVKRLSSQKSMQKQQQNMQSQQKSQKQPNNNKQQESQHKFQMESIHKNDKLPAPSQFQYKIDNEIFLGEVIVYGFAIKFANNVDLPEGTPLEFRHYLEQQKKKKGFKNSKKSEKNMNLRVTHNNSEFGRLKDEEVRILVPLLVHNMVRFQLFAFDIPRRMDYYTNIKLKARIYLTKKAITDPVVQTFEGQSDLIVSVYKPVSEEMLALFDRLQLPIKTWPLIKKKSKIKHNKDSHNQMKRESELQASQQEMRVSLNDRSRTDPFFKPVQKSLTEMMKLTTSKEDSNTATRSIRPQNASAVKKRIVEIKTIEEDKCAQLIDLYEEDLQPYQPTPNFTSQLYNYQALALSWMMRRQGHHEQKQSEKEEIHPLWTEYELKDSEHRLFMNELTSQISIKPPMSRSKCLGGILADEMGLGKTVMMAALMATNRVERKKKNTKDGGNLIVVPLTLLSQWDSQIKTHTKDIKTLIYYSADRNKYVKELQNYDVVITTYGTVSHEYSKGFHVSKNGLYRLKWQRVILDEAHYIKGRIIQTAKAVYEIDGLFRWCLTGTPIQNNLTDLFSLIHFIKYTPWAEYECWQKYITKPQEMGDENVYEVLKTILKRVFLRRTKQSKDNLGNSIVELPAKISKIQILQMSEKEQQFYNSIYENTKKNIEELDRLGILQAKYMQVLQILMRLRQICCHPILFKSIPNFIKDVDQFENELKKFVKKRELAAQTGEDGFKENYFQPVMEGEEEQRVEVMENRNISENYIKEVLTKIGSRQFQNCLVCLNEVQDPVITACLHIFCKTCAIRQIEQCGICSACRRRLVKQDILHLPRSNRFNISFEDGNYFKSTKLIALVEHLRALRPTDKVVVFSQFLGMLDLIEHEVKLEKFSYVRMEGSTAHKERTRIVHAFQNDPTVQIFIVSLKTAGVGLNLVAANKVFLMDPWWNPGVEDQAIERVHRIGQKRDVQVVRFVMDKSIEMRMVQLNTSKKKLSHKVLSQQGQPAGGQSKIEKLKYLMEKY